jgi:methyl-accepting chemotaxis protein
MLGFLAPTCQNPLEDATMNMSAVMRRFTIRTRMYCAIAIVLVLLLMVGGVGLYGLLHNENANEAYRQASFSEVSELSSMRETIGHMRQHEKNMLLDAGEALSVDKDAELWHADLKALRHLCERMLEGEEDEDNPIVRVVLGKLVTYQKAIEAVHDELQSGMLNGHDALGKLAPALALADQLDLHMQDIDKVMAKESAQSAQAQHDSVKHTIWAFAGVVLFALLVVTPSTILNQRCICDPIDEARRLAQAIAQGQLNNTVNSQGQDEASELLRGLQSMQQSLREMVTGVRVSADSISTASSEIASGNMDLSTRTESTASSLQETASSMEQLTGTVRHSAESAGQANALARAAADMAHRGSDIVSQVVSNMSEIDGTSKRINDIISVIDGIAFQTNILALNAAVEAARAGEQGRGFAVVAGEVRSLAQRSATAAREIKQLILASGQKVESGTRLVHDAGSAMGEILSSVQRVSDIIGEITAASSEQSSGISQVNQAVTNLDQMTQQNAALVEQSAAAAASLKDQAQRLTQAMAVFHV